MSHCRAMKSNTNTSTTRPHTSSIPQPTQTENMVSWYENIRQHLESPPQQIDKQHTQEVNKPNVSIGF